MDGFDKFKMIIAWGIAGVSGLWLFATLLQGIPSMGHLYLGGDLKLAALMCFVALLGIFAPKVIQESIFEDRKNRPTKEEASQKQRELDEHYQSILADIRKKKQSGL